MTNTAFSKTTILLAILALFAIALASYSATATAVETCECSISCDDGTSCSASGGSSCSCYCSGWTGNANCTGTATVAALGDIAILLFPEDLEASQHFVISLLSEGRASKHINDALAEASNAVEKKDKLTLETILKELDTYIQYSISAEQDRRLSRLFINQVD
ncbi:hypothetical protein EDC56_2497 [Sinobacterium caligoides]|uniref:EGF-like domain-containing protein n=1 Tax=Sinobacterium caligoides TaxID=933926 RepID=A0A3N2DQJ2_9GAMM|nr:hypothetical protein [Sinobacterium caligoides]ROS02047.1 hypothetical protein EDC56_2497 [Sinobacterium caligoides]